MPKPLVCLSEQLRQFAEYFALASTFPQEKVIVFVGSLNYRPNSEGVLHFCQRIWPTVLNHEPETKLRIIGIDPPDSIRAFDGQNNVEVLGFVPDVRPYLANARTAIVPIYSGSGTRLKILDAWAMGVPVVSTALGAEGLNTIQSENILLADSDDDFAQATVSLLRDRTLCERLKTAGRATVEQSYSWKQIGASLESAYRLAVERYKSKRSRFVNLGV